MDDKLIRLIDKYALIKNNEITMETSLNKDLGLYGDEALDFIEEFAQIFNVDISRFQFDNFFEPEGDMISSFISKKMGLIHERFPLTVQELINAIHNKVLK